MGPGGARGHGLSPGRCVGTPKSARERAPGEGEPRPLLGSDPPTSAEEILSQPAKREKGGGQGGGDGTCLRAEAADDGQSFLASLGLTRLSGDSSLVMLEASLRVSRLTLLVTSLATSAWAGVEDEDGSDGSAPARDLAGSPATMISRRFNLVKIGWSQSTGWTAQGATKHKRQGGPGQLGGRAASDPAGPLPFSLERLKTRSVGARVAPGPRASAEMVSFSVASKNEVPDPRLGLADPQ